MKTESEKIREIMESVEGIDLEHKKRKVMDALLSFPQNDLLQMYVDEFTDQEAMEYWLKVDADALPETPDIAREWLKANYTEESSSNLAEMIFDGWDEDDIQKMYSIYYDNEELDEIMGSEDVNKDPCDDIDYGEDMPDLVKAAHEDPQAWDRAMWGSRDEVDENMDEFGYDGDAEMDRSSTVQTQIDDIVAKSNAVIDKIGSDGKPTSEQERVLNGFADEITRLEKSLED